MSQARVLKIETNPKDEETEEYIKSIDEIGWLPARSEWVADRYLLFRSVGNPMVFLFDWETFYAIFFYDYPIDLIKEKILAYTGRGSAVNALKRLCGKSTLRLGNP